MNDIATPLSEHRFTPDESLRRDFLDDNHWIELARKFYIRLPRYGIPATDEKKMYWLRKFRVTEKQYLDMTGYEKLSDFNDLNPKWPLRAFVGLLLEYVNERDEARHVLRAYDR